MNRYCTAVLALFLTAGLVLPGSALADDPAPADDSTTATSLVANAWESDNNAAPQQDEPTLDVNFSGSLRFNVLFRDYGKPSEGPTINNELQDGGFTFDTFRIGANGSYGGLIFDVEYAVYPESFGGLYIHHGWVGYEFSDARQIQVGVSQVPFGIQPYASSSWFFNNTYYVGLEDDYDAGIKALYQANGWDIQGAYYMNSEQTTFFAGNDAARYSYDVVPSGGGGSVLAETRNIAEANQFNAKVAYSFDHGTLGFTKVGVSGQRGQLVNRTTGDTDWHAAYAAHLQGRYGGLEAKLEFAQQELNPPSVTDDRFVVMGAYASPNRVASEHNVYSSSLAYHIPVDAGPVSEIKPYYDFSQVTKEVDAWNDNVSHNIGFLTSAGPLFVYTDLNISKGHPFNQPFDGTFPSVMAENNDNEWRTAFNVNIGVYF
ncbi:hypothetical protein [Salinibacter altiplanensis]|uniref:hypothetical protein n=1 Tax=Salinibacter altiplanensis TaxID=1803181 RepID=UPI000C9F01B6|nr:hypothetical protein [Salinibacter altiplanensis]